MPSPVPLAVRGAATAHNPGATLPPSLGMAADRVLLADPCRDTVESLAWLLHLWGYEVYTAATGPAALEAARVCLPGAILMEIGLPELDGWQVARRLRPPGGGPAPLLVAVTGYGSKRDRALSREAGFDCHLVKPVRPEVVRACLVANCGRAGG